MKCILIVFVLQVCLQAGSILISLVTVALCTTTFQRYEAQVAGGRLPVLLLSPPELADSEKSIPLVPPRFCLRGQVIALEMDCSLGKVVAFLSWLLLIFGRILCIIISSEVHPNITLLTLFAHFSAMLLYLFSSQSTTLYDIPSRVVNAALSLIVLVEVSVRFHKVPLLYTLFFICIFVEDTYLMILFFLYRSTNCTESRLNCTHLGMYTYLTMNSHVIGIILLGVYLARLRPHRKSVVTSQSTSESMS